MAILYRAFSNFRKATLGGRDLGGHNFDVASEWTTAHIPHCGVGERRNVGSDWERRDSIFMPSESDFQLVSGMDEPCAFKVEIDVGVSFNDSVTTSLSLVDGIMEDPAAPNAINWDHVNGRYYDSINNFGRYPHNTALKGSHYQSVSAAPGFSGSYALWYPPGSGNTHRENLFRNGYHIKASNFVPTDPSGWANNKACWIGLNPRLIHIQYLNCVVNSISPKNITTAAGQTIIFTGLGFNNSNADIAGGWPHAAATADMVDRIYFDNLRSGVTYTYVRMFPAAPPSAPGRFNINSNSEIELLTSAMNEGEYQVRMYKQEVSIAGQARTFNITDYAGDWRCEEDGRAYRAGIEGFEATGRHTILVSDCYAGVGDFRARGTGASTGCGGGGSVILTTWTFKDRLGNKIFRHFSELDAPAADKFYDGRITSIGSINQTINHKTGLYAISDLTVDLANNDKYFSMLLDTYMIKNQYVVINHLFMDEPEGWKSSIMVMIVDDHEWIGGDKTLRVYLKDATQKYFQKKVPLYQITEDEYPDAHEDALDGKAMPEALGLCFLDGEKKGAIKAHYVDTVNFKYLLARASMHSVTQVYSNQVLMATPADYSIVYEDGGRTIIDFVLDQGDNEIRANGTGYMFPLWNSANGYVQNPAYIISFYLTLLAEMPISLFNMAHFDDMAAIYVTRGEDESGYLILQDVKDIDEELKRLLWTYGAKIFPDNLGRLVLDEKNIYNWQTTRMIYDQMDSITPALRKPQEKNAVNYSRAVYNHYPAASLFLGSIEYQNDLAIEDFEGRIEAPDSPWQFPWTTSKSMAQRRLRDELLRISYGDKKISFPIAVQWIDQIQVFDNFRYQDEFGINITGEGRVGQYFYCEEKTLNFGNRQIDIIGADLEWLIRQCFILGERHAPRLLFPAASVTQRLYGFLCNRLTKRFSNGWPGKKLCARTPVP